MSSARRVVFDTSTLIGALLVPDSPPRRALMAAREWCELCGSEPTLREFESVILRAKFDRYLDRAARRDFAVMIRQHTRLFSVSEADEAQLPRACRDPRDNKFLTLALACEAGAIVSSDTDLTSMNPYAGIAMVTATDFLLSLSKPRRT